MPPSLPKYGSTIAIRDEPFAKLHNVALARLKEMGGSFEFFRYIGKSRVCPTDRVHLANRFPESWRNLTSELTTATVADTVVMTEQGTNDGGHLWGVTELPGVQ
jgi:hypothetical protein